MNLKNLMHSLYGQKRLAAMDVIDFIVRHKENEDFDERLTAIEQRLSEQK